MLAVSIVSYLSFDFLPQVPYNTVGWLDKNKDPLNDNVVELFKKSSDAWLASIWQDRVADAGVPPSR